MTSAMFYTKNCYLVLRVPFLRNLLVSNCMNQHITQIILVVLKDNNVLYFIFAQYPRLPPKPRGVRFIIC